MPSIIECINYLVFFGAGMFFTLFITSIKESWMKSYEDGLRDASIRNYREYILVEREDGSRYWRPREKKDPDMPIEEHLISIDKKRPIR